MTNTISKVTDGLGLSNKAENEKAGAAAQEASRLQADYQTQALDYLKQQEALPTELREGALTNLGALYGVNGGDQQAALASLKASPLYEAIMSGQQAGENSILRNASVTGGVRTGNTQGALAQYNQDLSTQALMSGLSGLQGLASLGSYAPEIAGMTTGIGTTLAQGDLARAQGHLAGSDSYVTAGRQERQYGHEIGMSMLGGDNSMAG